MHSPGHSLGRTHGGRTDMIYPLMPGSNPFRRTEMGPFSGMVSGGRLRATVFYPYSPSDSRHPLSCRDKHPGTGDGLTASQSWEQGTPGQSPFPTTGPPLTIGTRCPWPGDNVARLWRLFLPSSIIAGQWRVSHRSPTVQLRSFLSFLFSFVRFILSHTHTNRSTIGPAECG